MATATDSAVKSDAKDAKVKNVQVQASLSPELFEKLKEYRFDHRIDKQSDVVKLAIEKLLAER